jgi:hypothetical protein
MELAPARAEPRGASGLIALPIRFSDSCATCSTIPPDLPRKRQCDGELVLCDIDGFCRLAERDEIVTLHNKTLFSPNIVDISGRSSCCVRLPTYA